MIRKLMILTAALAAALAPGAMASATASATQFHSEVIMTKISGAGTSAHVFSAPTVTVTCQQASLQGVMPQKTQGELTLAPEYSGCDMKISGGLPIAGVTFKRNECVFVISTFSQHQIGCPAGKAVEFSVNGCVLTIVPSYYGSATTYTNNGKHVDADLVTDQFFKTSGFLCGTTQGAGTYSGTLTLSGKAQSGQPVKIWHE